MTYLIYDAVILVLLLFFFLRGRKKGLVLTLCGLATIFIALFGARMASDFFAPTIADLLAPRFSPVIEEQLDNGLEEKLNEMLASGEEGGNLLVDLLTKFGLYDDVSSAIQNAVSGQTAQTITDVAISLSHAVAEVVAGVLVFVVAFLAIIVLWFFLSHALDLAARLPVINGLNRTLGGLFGLLEGMLLLFLIAWVMRLLGGVIPEEAVNQTTLLNFFFTTNPISLIAGI
ncbi:MAG: hypothetical protein E7440_03855 [Ruminococcaceae bacterium]|nr:hypothetical protein [Oscillospiraceae bacterium]